MPQQTGEFAGVWLKVEGSMRVGGVSNTGTVWWRLGKCGGCFAAHIKLPFDTIEHCLNLLWMREYCVQLNG